MRGKHSVSGVSAALLAPVFLGMAPIFTKLALQAEADPFAIAAIRTLAAAGLLWVVYSLFVPKYIYIYPAGLMGCIVVGTVNGVGSLFYYSGFNQLHNASLAQLLNGMYLPLALLMSGAVGQKINGRILLRVMLAVLGLTIITGFSAEAINWLGVGLMLANAVMFAGTLILSQYVLFEMPAPTVTLYVLSTMAVFVFMVWLVVGEPMTPQMVEASALPILSLAITTALSRLAMFAGVKLFGGMQTAVLAITEIGVALLMAALVLGEALTLSQGVGVAILIGSLLLIRQQDLLPHGFNPNALIVANMASVQFQRIAFHRAFGTHDNEQGTMAQITTQELALIQRMMGAQNGPLDPFPIGKVNASANLQLITDTLEQTPLDTNTQRDT